MSRRDLLGFVVALCLSGAAAAAPPQAAPPLPPAQPPAVLDPNAPGPRIVFDAINLNLGNVVHGEEAVAVFTYHNKGDVPLHILSAKPG